MRRYGPSSLTGYANPSPAFKVRIYFDFRDWWVGYYRGSNLRIRTHYVCIIPTLVISWPMRKK